MALAWSHRKAPARGVACLGVGGAVPPTTLDNDHFAQRLDTSDAWIHARTGIRTRHVERPGDPLLALSLPAAQEALAMAQVGPEAVDLIVVATSSPDHPMPSEAALLQAALGVPAGAACWDVAAACTGFVVAMAQAHQAIALGAASCALVVGVDALSRFMDPGDRGTAILFGDGAGAVVLQASESPGILAYRLGADGRQAQDLVVAPVVAPDAVPEGFWPPKWMRMNGRAIYRFVLEVVPPLLEDLLTEAGLRQEELKALVPHQANGRMLESLAHQVGLPAERLWLNLERLGNTSAASIPLVMAERAQAGELQAGDLLALVGFGSGLTWGGILLRWGGPTIPS